MTGETKMPLNLRESHIDVDVIHKMGFTKDLRTHTYTHRTDKPTTDAKSSEPEAPNPSKPSEFHEKLKLLKVKLEEWNKEVFGCLDSRQGDLVKQIQILDIIGEASVLSEDQLSLRKNYMVEWWSTAKKKDCLMVQKSRARWLKEGDANTSFFYACINNRRKRNHIHGVWIDGEWIEDDNGLLVAVSNYFHMIIRFVSLNDAFSEDEIKEVVNYKLPRGLNSSFIILIPKLKNPTRTQDIRTISLVGSLNKILAKEMAEKLKEVMASLILPSQSAFIQGRNILV
ncbi:PREDICTED: uncharacterized protein LOC109332505 [Lupinus angustifolius]|uniref:uncharacterized protein LOC109332505 n=1 Tax=Lupinus angustifolius TaxID=3871 RepID=UPI00092F2391|nr:PREDICTED: uncharacterized protein LOC109332505 [Lupinus angustifolius]